MLLANFRSDFVLKLGSGAHQLRGIEVSHAVLNHGFADDFQKFAESAVVLKLRDDITKLLRTNSV